jgi:hypothetical protein
MGFHADSRGAEQVSAEFGEETGPTKYGVLSLICTIGSGVFPVLV